jgi:hypothetical protein
MTGKIWATRVITTMWQQIYDGWELHNDKVHGKQQKTDDQDLRRRVVTNCFYLHSKKKQVLPDHIEYLFLPDLRQTVRTATIQFLRNWLRLYESAIQESIRIAQSNAVRHTSS